MKFIIDEIPIYCPKCGKETKIKDNALCVIDFTNGCCHKCNCGADYQFVKTDKIIEVAIKHGDSEHFWVNN